MGTRAVLMAFALAPAFGCVSAPKDPAQVTAEDRALAAEGVQLLGDLLRAGETARAAEIADEVLARDPYEPANQLAAARAKSAHALATENARLYDDAVRAASFACDALPRDAAAHLVRGQLEFDRQHYTRALADFEHVVELDPNNVEALRRAAWTRRQLRQPKAELAAWERLVAAVPADPVGSYRLGTLLLRAKNSDPDVEAEDRARGRQLIERAAADPEAGDLALHAAAALRAESGDASGAEALLRRAIAAADGDAARQADATFNLGALLEQQGRLAEARDAYEDALAIDRDETRATANLGGVLVQLGEVAEGRRLLAAARDAADGAARRELDDVLEATRPADSGAADDAGGGEDGLPE